MEFWKYQKRTGTAFAFFLAFMLLCTLISRAVYASGLAQVTAETPRRMSLTHKVEAEGIVSAGQEYALSAPPGVRVRTVCIREGDRVAEGTLLFEADTDDLEEKLQELRLQIRKAQLQLQALEQTAAQDAQEKQTEQSRAAEDYERTDRSTKESVSRAEEDLHDAEKALERLEESPVSVTPEKERKAAQAAYEQWAARETELKAASEQADRYLADAEEKIREAEAALQEAHAAGKDTAGAEARLAEARASGESASKAASEAKAAWDAHAASPVTKPDYTAEDEALAQWRERREELRTQVGTAERAAADAQQSRSDSLLEAERKKQDAASPEAATADAETARLELQSLQADAAGYAELLEADGQVRAGEEGVVTKVLVSPGEQTGEGAAVVCADPASPLLFTVSLTKEQKKYVNQGDTATLTLGGSASEVTVDYLSENEANPQTYDVRVFLEAGEGTIGQSGAFSLTAQSQTYDCCIPLAALRQDENQRSYVYTVGTRSGILGEELSAEKIYVTALDRNESYAAVEAGTLKDVPVISDSTEELSDRQIIRYKD
ncbi:MAG: hypothetical protein Q4C82_04810 [Eubacteriales bacterium]|nr:hypothetical protein [Eubacteriales bacterium]